MSTINDAIASATLFLVAAIAAGLLGGAGFFWIWRRIVPRPYTARFWRTLPAHTQGMLRSEDPSDMLVHYKALLVSLAAFAGRNSLGLVLGLLPMALFYSGLVAYDPSDDLAADIEVHPVTIETEPRGRVSAPGDGRLLIDRRAVERANLEIASESLDPALLDNKIAICPTALRCLVPELMLFETREAVPGSALEGIVLVRPAHFDSNPLWPYLNDLDVWFFAAAIAGSMGTGWLTRRSRPAPA